MRLGRAGTLKTKNHSPCTAMCPQESVSLGHEALPGVTWTHFEPRAATLRRRACALRARMCVGLLYATERGAAKPGRAARALHTRTQTTRASAPPAHREHFGSHRELSLHIYHAHCGSGLQAEIPAHIYNYLKLQVLVSGLRC